MSRPKNLYDLQIIDSQLDQHRARITAIDKALADDKAVIAGRKKAQAAQGSFETVHKALLKAKEIVKEQRDKIKQSNDLLYGGTVRNPKELGDIQDEIAALKRHLDTIEERQLEAMLNFDEAQDVRDQAKNLLDQALAEAEKRNAALVEEKHQHQNSIQALETQRRAQASRAEPADLEAYERIRIKRGGVGAAKVQDRTCSACGSTLASALFQQARSPSKITHCHSCERILYAE
ncbi:MAG: hypothetical protein HN413_13780 [Chloroflexi bacterium]|jgi:predicted  nucleic acid-binding Zn-ribbon protein|nr:hypothetical protein [Chloroflexota bacterium]